MSSKCVVVDIAALAELTYTGIPAVVADVAQQFIERDDAIFAIGNSVVPKSIVRRCLGEWSGLALQMASVEGYPWTSIFSALRGCQASVGVYTNIPQGWPVRHTIQVAYDLVPLLLDDLAEPQTASSYRRSFLMDYPKADRIIAISEATRWSLVTYLDIEPSRVQVATPAVVAPDGEPLPLRFSRRLCLVVGTIEPRKNLDYILGQIARDPEICEEWDFLFVGKDGWRTTFDELVERFGLSLLVEEGRIWRLPFVTEEAKWRLLSAADALAFPSHFEGYGMPVAEAGLFDTPVIASQTSSVPEAATGRILWLDQPDSTGTEVSLRALLRAAIEAPQMSEGGTTRRRTSVVKTVGRAATLAVDELIGGVS